MLDQMELKKNTMRVNMSQCKTANLWKPQCCLNSLHYKYNLMPH